MKKSKDISKYDIHWQVRRVTFKDLKNYQAKCEAAKQYLLSHLNRADRERILNYLEGLSKAYKGVDREYIMNVFNELSILDVSNESVASLDFECYTRDILARTAKDNMVRCSAYLKKGYRHLELIHFTRELYRYLNDEKSNKALVVLEELETNSYNIENSVHFFF